MNRYLVCFIVLFIVISARRSHAQTITTVAGGSVGDGGLAIYAPLDDPEGLTFDHHGNLYIVDQEGNRVRMVSPSGIITTLAGNGGIRNMDHSSTGDEGDGFMASSAPVRITFPSGICFDATGTAFIAEQGHIREVYTSGIIDLYGGLPICFAYDDGVPITATAMSANSIAVDASGNLYIDDYWENTIRKVDAAGYVHAIDTAGTMPFSVTTDRAGNVYYCDDAVVRKVSSTGVKSIYAGSVSGFGGDGGPATSALLGYPRAIVFDSAGNLYIGDLGNNHVRKVDTSGIITTIAGTGVGGHSGDGGPALSADICTFAIAVDDSGNVYIAGGKVDHSVRKISLDGSIRTIAGHPSNPYSGGLAGSALNAQFSYLTSVLADGAGGFYFADAGYHMVHKVDASGNISTFVGNGSDGNTGDGGPASAASLSVPIALAKDAIGNVYICDQQNAVVRKVNTAGIITTVAGLGTSGYFSGPGPATASGFLVPQIITTDYRGNLYIGDAVMHAVFKVDTTGNISRFAGTGLSGPTGDGGPATAAVLNGCTGIAADSNGNVYILDYRDMRKVDTAGIITSITGGGGAGYGCEGDGGPFSNALLNSYGITFDTRGNTYLSSVPDYFYSTTIRVVDTGGMINTFAGVCDSEGFRGDGGPATAALISPVGSVSADDSGVYFVDMYNNRVRHISVVVHTSETKIVSGIRDGIAVYPNPFDKEFTITNAPGHAQFRLFDIMGKQVIQALFTERSDKEFTCHIDGIPGGTYILVVYDAHGERVQTIPLSKK